jgi:hypothetical protein
MSSFHPSKAAFRWPCSGKYSEFASFVTHPQEDHREDGTGIKIRAEFDQRAQPLWQHVQANMHTKKIWRLPNREAEVEVVQEFIYLILTGKSGCKVADDKPQYVTATVSRWNTDGAALRGCVTRCEYLSLIPKGYTDVYGQYHTIPTPYIYEIQERLYQVIEPLLRAERKEEARKPNTRRLEKYGNGDKDKKLVSVSLTSPLFLLMCAHNLL